MEHVAAALRLLKQEDCYVGKSGADWVGVYDKRNEDDGGAKLAELSRGLSLALSDAYVLGFSQAEDGFSYWLYQDGRQLDTHPRSIKGALFVRRTILDLCPHKDAKDRVFALLEPRTVATPVDFGMTEEELRIEIQRNKSKGRTMSARVKMAKEQRKIFHTDRYAIEVISKILGIEYFWLLYSDFSPYDLPPTFVHVNYLLP
ncbi:MAG: hypothetical protein ACXWDN_10120 [Limisphaerales bacterium]